MIRNADLAKIHMGKKQLGLDDETYRVMLDEMFGVTSAGKLNSKQRYRLIRHMEERGAVFVSKNEKNSHAQTKKVQRTKNDFYAIPDGVPFVSQKRYLLVLWKKLGWKLSGVDTRMKRQYGIESLAWIGEQYQMQTVLNDVINRCRKKGINVEKA